MSGTSSMREGKLHRALTLPLLILYGLGVTVGAGIYVLVGATAGAAGAYAPVSFLIAAIIVAFSAASYAELSGRFPVSAGEAAYVEAGFRTRGLTLIVGLLVALSGIVSASAVAIGAAEYLGALLGISGAVATLGVVLAMAGLAVWGITQSVTVAAVITVIEIAGLCLVIAWAEFAADAVGIGLSDMLPPLSGAHWGGIAAATVLAFFAFVGFEDMANVAEEVIDPVHTMPRAIAVTLVVATGLYVWVCVSVLSVVPLERLASAEAPLVLVFADAPEGVQSAFAAIAVVATVNGVLIQMIMSSRVLYGLADRGHLPALLARVARRTQTPVVATALVAGIIMVLTQVFPIEALAERTSQIVLAVFLLVNLSLIRLKLRGDNSHVGLRVPFAVPVIGAVTSVALFGAGFL
ncbi:APC family permease [Shimia ponticola]|uniref:APC family permease n=1 Tax=Shimia ponticola TaxID=2582893 RepID=UPI00164A9A16|nr:APC family permease [Shimia ponticola]